MNHRNEKLKRPQKVRAIFAAPDFLRMALELGAARCLRKPFTPDALLAAIRDCLAEPHAATARLG